MIHSVSSPPQMGRLITTVWQQTTRGCKLIKVPETTDQSPYLLSPCFWWLICIFLLNSGTLFPESRSSAMFKNDFIDSDWAICALGAAMSKWKSAHSTYLGSRSLCYDLPICCSHSGSKQWDSLWDLAVRKSVWAGWFAFAVLPGKQHIKPFIRRLGFFYWLKAIKISLQQGMLSLQFKSGRIETKHFVLLPVVNKGNKPMQKGK